MKAKAIRTCLSACVLAVSLAGCGGNVELLSNLTERDANEVLAALSEVDIKAQKLPGKEGAVNLVVDNASVARAIAHLNTEGLPRERRSTMGDVFKKEGLISSPLEERARYLWALSQELSETISQIDGVMRARVHVVLPERSTGGEPPLPSSAAVFVKYRGGVGMDDTVPQIRRLVANSIPGLTVEKVNVVLVQAGARPQTNMGAASAAGPAGKPAKPAVKTNGTAYVWLAVLLGIAALGALGATFWWMRKSRIPEAAGADETAMSNV